MSGIRNIRAFRCCPARAISVHRLRQQTLNYSHKLSAGEWLLQERTSGNESVLLLHPAVGPGREVENFHVRTGLQDLVGEFTSVRTGKRMIGDEEIERAVLQRLANDQGLHGGVGLEDAIPLAGERVNDEIARYGVVLNHQDRRHSQILLQRGARFRPPFR
jgi:hypothetical protein